MSRGNIYDVVIIFHFGNILELRFYVAFYVAFYVRFDEIHFVFEFIGIIRYKLVIVSF
jgi:hypothetical protein